MTSKLFIPSEVLESIVCMSCSNYLSVFPVFTKVDGSGAICGRCKLVDIDKYIRDEAYEGIAQFLVFPCEHASNGCKDYLSPLKLEDHEPCCSFKKFDCPSKNYSKCSWKGARTELLEHFKQKHSTLLLKEPNFELDFVNSQEERFLLSHNDKLFIVKKVVDARKGIFSCSVEHLKSNEESITYGHFLKIESANKNYFSRCPYKSTCNNEVLNTTELTKDIISEKLEGSNAIIVNIEIVEAKSVNDVNTEEENLSKDDSKQHSNVNWELLCEMECPVCYDFMLPPIFHCINGHSICEICEKKVKQCPVCKIEINKKKNYVLEKLTQHIIYPCKYYKNGCKYSCKSTEIKDHEICCKFGPYFCPLKEDKNCEWKASHGELAGHIDTSHSESILNTDKIDVTFNKTTPCKKSYLIKYDNNIFKHLYLYENNIFNWCVQLVGLSNKTKQYRFEIDILDLSESKRRCYFMGLVETLTSDQESFTNTGKYVLAPLQQIESFANANLSYRVRVIKE